MRQAFFHDQPESEAMPDLGQQVRDNDRLACAGHSKQDAVLRSVSKPAPDPDQVPSRPVVNGFSPFEVPGERRGPGDQVRQVGVFGWEIEGSIGAKGPSGTGPPFVSISGLAERNPQFAISIRAPAPFGPRSSYACRENRK